MLELPYDYSFCYMTEKIANQRALRTFARNFSNIDFFLKISPLKDDVLVMPEM